MRLNIFIILLISILLLPTGARAGGGDGRAGFESYTFEREIHLAPGEFYAVTYDDALKEFVETEPDRKYGCLPDRALRQILRAPLWLREDFADRLVDLYYDEIKVGEDARPVFADINGDGLLDLVVGNSGSEPQYYVAPYFGRETANCGGIIASTESPSTLQGFEATGKEDGSLDVTVEGEVDPQLIENLRRIKVAGNAYPIFEDVTTDGLPDLLIGSSDGTISVYENYGTHDKWWFVSNRPETDRKFDDDIGYLSSPRIHDVNGDNIEDIITGGKDIGGLKIYYGPDFTETGGFTYDPDEERLLKGSIVPAPCDFNRDGICDFAIGLDDGSIYIFIVDENGVAIIDKSLSRGLQVPGYAAPCTADFNNDDMCDMVVGAGDGKIYFFKGTETGFEIVDDYFGELEVGEYPSPAAYDYNNDGNPDLVVGNKSGEIHVFLAPDWEEVEGGLGISNSGGYSSPAFGDLTGDGVPEMLIGSLDGTFRYCEGRGNKWAEKYSWIFHPTYGISEIEDFFTRTHPDATLFRGAIDDDAINAFLDELENCPDEFIDEVAFVIGNTQTEILRVMSRLDNADLVVENARAIYDFASKVKYANVIEKDDYTTIEYFNEDGILREMPRDIYYWWVVHPVVEYEIPSRIDASYWRHDAEYYGTPGEEWTRKEITVENYEHTQSAYFWRTFLPVDRRYGKSLLDVVENAGNIEEAAYLIADWITFSGSKPGRWNEYGLQSSDLQPLVIYEKNYGSCGEQAMLGVAFSRTALIPNAPVGCHGEDHAWNEWWMDGKWYKWDVGSAMTDMGHPWYEGRGHTGTPRLTITRRRGDGVVENTTTLPVNPPGSNFIPGNAPGYSEVGKAHIRVVDEENEPIEGAFIIVRSKWNNYYRTSIWDYTDPEGYCYFELGDPITGSCVVDIITPLGVTGTEYFVVRENEEFEYTYTLPGRFNVRKPEYSPRTSSGSGSETIEVSMSVIEEEQRPANYSGSRKDESKEKGLFKETGYYGTRWFSNPNDSHCGVYSAKLSAQEYDQFRETYELPRAEWTKEDYIEPFSPDSGDVFVFYNPNRYTHVRFNATLSVEVPGEKPDIEITSAPVSTTTGEKVIFTGNASDNLHVNTLKVSFNGGMDYKDISNSYNSEMQDFSYTWDTGDGGPATPGVYEIVFRVEDDSGNYAETGSIDFTLLPATRFTDQVIYQDNAESPLPKSSWMLGPFTVNENERFLGIEGSSSEPEFDMDLFLYYDKNGNRTLDGAGEQIAKSTSATAMETVLHNNPQPGVYWVFCQGWQVKERTDIDPWEGIRDFPPGKLMLLETVDVNRLTTYALLDVALSFEYTPAFIVDVRPSRKLLITEPEITGSFLAGFDVDPESFTVIFDGEDISKKATINPEGFALSLDGSDIEVGDEYSLRIEADTMNGLHDSIDITLIAVKPEKVQVSHSIDAENEMMSVEVNIINEGDNLDSARARIDDEKWVKLNITDGGMTAASGISLKKTEKGEHTLTVEYQVDGEPESKEISFKYGGKKQTSLIKLMPGDGAKVFDHQSVLVVYYSLDIKNDVAGISLLLDGEDITGSSTVYSDGAIYLPDEIYSKGEHIFKVTVTLSDKSVIESQSTFTIMSMDDEDEPALVD